MHDLVNFSLITFGSASETGCSIRTMFYEGSSDASKLGAGLILDFSYLVQEHDPHTGRENEPQNLATF